MDKQFLVDCDFLSPAALAHKHRLEQNPDCRTDHMVYLPGMERLNSDICAQVIGQMQDFTDSDYTARDVQAALAHEVCTPTDFRRPSLFWRKWRSVRSGKPAAILAILFICSRRFILPIIVKITVFTAVLTVITRLSVCGWSGRSWSRKCRLLRLLVWRKFCC